MALRERPRARRRPQATSALVARRVPLPLGLAVAALVLAVIAAIGPAKDTQTRWRWPARALPAGQPQKLWYTPLLLTRQEPQSLTATVPCKPARALPGAARPTLVFATGRDAARRLTAYEKGGRLVVGVGDTTLASVPLLDKARPGCAYRLDVHRLGWSLTGGAPGVVRNGSLEQMPVVTGLFSALDLRASARPAVEVTSVVHDVRPRLHQGILWALSLVAAAASLALVAGWSRWRPRSARPLLGPVGLADAAVVGLLLVWWIVGPAFYDDGWVAARQRNYGAAGGFSAYYTSFGVNLPLDYWVEWLEHWLAGATNALLLLRLPALLCLLATWALCRWTAARFLPAAGSKAVGWAFACAFAVGALAWGMTFRPEPVVALLVSGVVACTVAFVERESAGTLAGAATLAVLALTAHPAGIVALAPLLAAAPAIARWVRGHVGAAMTVLTCSIATLVVFASLGSDLQQRRTDAASLRAFGDETAGWRDELSRYTLLAQAPFGTPLRRASAALILLAVAAYLFRRRDREHVLLGLPARALGFALLLFFLTPTKWPWHFGALIGLAALALAAETARLREDAAAARGWSVRPLLVVGAAVAAAAWSWNPRNAWGDLDLRTLHWTLGFESRLTLSKLFGALPVVVLAVLALVALATVGPGRLRAVPWRAALWTVPVVAVPLIAFTLAVLVADAKKTSSWTLARQNVDTLRGDIDCGLADGALVPARSSMRAVRSEGAAGAGPAPGWLPPTPVVGLESFALPPGRASRWFRLPQRGRVGFFLAPTAATDGGVQLEWGRRTGMGKVVPLGTAVAAADVGSDARPDLAYWRFYAAGDLPATPSDANAMRFSLGRSAQPLAPIGLTAPVSYEDVSLATLLKRSEPVLALPGLLPYLPCIRQPRVGDSAETPRLLVGFRNSLWPIGTGTSPFDGLTDVYPIVRLPLSDSGDPPAEVAVYELGPPPEGAALAPATARVLH